MKTTILSVLAIALAALGIGYWSGWFESPEVSGRDSALPTAEDAVADEPTRKVDLARPEPSLDVVGVEETVPAVDAERPKASFSANAPSNPRFEPAPAAPIIPSAKETELALLRNSLEDIFDDSEHLDRFTPWLEQHLQAEQAWAAGSNGAAAAKAFNAALEERLDELAETFEPEIAAQVAERLSLQRANEDGTRVRIDWRGKPIEEVEED